MRVSKLREWVIRGGCLEWGRNKKADAQQEICDLSIISIEMASVVDGSRSLPVAPAMMGAIIPIQALHKHFFEFQVCARHYVLC